MIKDILVHVPTECPARPAIDASVSLAATFCAHLDAMAIGYILSSAAYVMDGSAAAAVAAVFEMEQERAAERATAALAFFEIEARDAGISYECRAITNLPGDAAASIGAAARLRNLAVVLQPEAERQTYENGVLTDILLLAGGPVLFVPHIWRGPFMVKRIGICWDGSRLAARALKDAIPFLTRADALYAISVNSAESVLSDASSEKLVENLSRAGLPIKLIDLPASHSDIQPSILSLAADENLHMLVMGAYGHLGLREGLLGGVTREMLRTMKVPTLIPIESRPTCAPIKS